jgi:hypothetical protein
LFVQGCGKNQLTLKLVTAYFTLHTGGAYDQRKQA